jgi:hypothetical protein
MFGIGAVIVALSTIMQRRALTSRRLWVALTLQVTYLDIAAFAARARTGT